MAEVKLLAVELAKVSPFALLLFVCLKVVWNRFLRKDAAMTEQMIESNQKLLAVTKRIVDAQLQNALSSQKLSHSLDKNSEAIGLLTETIDDNHAAMMRKLEGLEPVKVKKHPARPALVTDAKTVPARA